jgi:hypothetical protein
MKKMNKMYEAPKAEVVELNLNKDFMQTWIGGSVEVEEGDDL